MSANSQSQTVEQPDDRSSTKVYEWVTEKGYTYVTDENDIVSLHRLTAFAEYGEEALDADTIHHALYCEDDEGGIRVDAPAFLVPLDHGEHSELHREGEWREVGGILQLRPED